MDIDVPTYLPAITIKVSEAEEDLKQKKITEWKRKSVKQKESCIKLLSGPYISNCIRTCFASNCNEFWAKSLDKCVAMLEPGRTNNIQDAKKLDGLMPEA